MAATLIVINADTSWDFRRHVRTLALDLYPVQRDVFFWDAVPPAAGAMDLDPLLGAFPEDFSQADTGMAGELVSATRDLVAAQERRLAVVVVLSAPDYAVLEKDAGAIRAQPGRADLLSPPGRAVLDALGAALALLRRERANADEGALAGAMFGAWIVVRDRGHVPRQDALASTRLITQLRDTKDFHLTGMFFLSNGEAGNAHADAEAIQFFKLRALVDMLGDREASAALKLAGDTGRRSFWMEMPAPQSRPAMRSEYLARRLWQALEELQAQGAAATGPEEDKPALASISEVKAAVDAMSLPEEAGARTRIQQMAAASRDQTEDGAGLRAAKSDQDDMSRAIDALKRAWRKGIFFSQPRRDRILNARIEFTTAFQSAQVTQDAVVDALLADESDDARDARRRILVQLGNFHTPRSPEGKEQVAGLIQTLHNRIGDAEMRIAQAVSRRGDAVRDLQARLPGRDDAFATVIASEENMLRPSALQHPLVAIFAFCLPPLLWEVARSRNLVTGFDLAKAVTLVLQSYVWVILPLLVLSILVMAGVWWGLHKRRRKAQGFLVGHLEQDRDLVATVGAGRYVASASRRIAGHLRLALNGLQIGDDLSQADLVEGFAEQLRHETEGRTLPPNPELERLIADRLAQTMGRGTSIVSRLRSALAAPAIGQKSRIDIEAPDLRGGALSIETTATVHELRLRLSSGSGVPR